MNEEVSGGDGLVDPEPFMFEKEVPHTFSSLSPFRYSIVFQGVEDPSSVDVVRAMEPVYTRSYYALGGQELNDKIQE
jgi:hypothetical protein